MRSSQGKDSAGIKIEIGPTAGKYFQPASTDYCYTTDSLPVALREFYADADSNYATTAKGSWFFAARVSEANVLQSLNVEHYSIQPKLINGIDFIGVFSFTQKTSAADDWRRLRVEYREHGDGVDILIADALPSRYVLIPAYFGEIGIRYQVLGWNPDDGAFSILGYYVVDVQSQ